jgi:formylglycine-generating enzyme required for sulfatase activity
MTKKKLIVNDKAYLTTPTLWSVIGVLSIIILMCGLTGCTSEEATPTSSEELLQTETSMPSPTLTDTPSPSPTFTMTVMPSDTPTNTSTPTEVLGVGSEYTNPNDDAKMVYVPEGDFLMGSEAISGNDGESPEHTVYLDAFWIYKYEVTNAQFTAFLNAEGNQEEEGATWLGADNFDVQIHQEDGQWTADEGYMSHPVIFVNWYGAQAYCKWAGGQLPTEAEWEKAARGQDGQTYPWGEQELNCNLVDYDCVVGTSPVGSYPAGASPYGALDMAGNVMEWVADWWAYDSYSTSSDENPTGPTSGTNKVLRGGSWFGIWGHSLVSADRYKIKPTEDNYYIGFRCAYTTP